MKINSRIFFWAKLLVSAAFIFILFYKFIDINTFLKLFVTVSPWFFILLILINLITRLFEAKQAELCFYPFQIKFRRFEIFRAKLIMQFYSFLVPSELMASVVTWYLLSRENKQNANVASALIFQKMVNLSILLPFAAIGFLFEPRLEQFNIAPILLIITALFICCMLPFFMPGFTKFFEKLLSVILRNFRLSKFDEKIKPVWEAFRTYQKLPLHVVLRIILVSLGILTLTIVFFIVSFESLDLNVPYSASFWLLPMLTVINYLPISFAGIGPREMSMVFLFDFLYGVPSEQTLMNSFLILVVIIIFAIAGGVLHFFDKKKTSAMAGSKLTN